MKEFKFLAFSAVFLLLSSCASLSAGEFYENSFRPNDKAPVTGADKEKSPKFRENKLENKESIKLILDETQYARIPSYEEVEAQPQAYESCGVAPAAAFSATIDDSSFSHRPDMLKPRMQTGNQCVAYVAATVMEYKNYLATGTNSRLSPQFIFHYKPANMSGMPAAMGFEVLRDHGGCLATLYGTDWRVEPTQAALDDASHRRVIGPVKIDKGGLPLGDRQQKLKDVKSALLTYGPLEIALPRYRGKQSSLWWRQSPTNTRRISGHVMTVVGWDDNITFSDPQTGETFHGAFQCQNTYIMAFSDGTHSFICWYPYDDFIAGLHSTILGAR